MVNLEGLHIMIAFHMVKVPLACLMNDADPNNLDASMACLQMVDLGFDNYRGIKYLLLVMVHLVAFVVVGDIT